MLPLEAPAGRAQAIFALHRVEAPLVFLTRFPPENRVPAFPGSALSFTRFPPENRRPLFREALAPSRKRQQWRVDDQEAGERQHP